jgi:hypothetical protein
MPRITFILLFISVVLLSACSSSEKQEPATQSLGFNFIRIAGTWYNNYDNDTIYEKWYKINDSLYKGNSVLQKDNDTTILEYLEISTKNGEWHYSPIAVGQNFNKSVHFKLKHQSKDTLIFENLLHDYPQNISYYFIGKDSLNAVISGTHKNKIHSKTYAFKKVD